LLIIHPYLVSFFYAGSYYFYNPNWLSYKAKISENLGFFRISISIIFSRNCLISNQISYGCYLKIANRFAFVDLNFCFLFAAMSIFISKSLTKSFYSFSSKLEFVQDPSILFFLNFIF